MSVPFLRQKKRGEYIIPFRKEKKTNAGRIPKMVFVTIGRKKKRGGKELPYSNGSFRHHGTGGGEGNWSPPAVPFAGPYPTRRKKKGIRGICLACGE